MTLQEPNEKQRAEIEAKAKAKEHNWTKARADRIYEGGFTLGAHFGFDLGARSRDEEIAALKAQLERAVEVIRSYSRSIIEDGCLQVNVQWINDRELSGKELDTPGELAEQFLRDLEKV